MIQGCPYCANARGLLAKPIGLCGMYSEFPRIKRNSLHIFLYAELFLRGYLEIVAPRVYEKLTVFENLFEYKF